MYIYIYWRSYGRGETSLAKKTIFKNEKTQFSEWVEGRNGLGLGSNTAAWAGPLMCYLVSAIQFMILELYVVGKRYPWIDDAQRRGVLQLRVCECSKLYVCFQGFRCPKKNHSFWASQCTFG